MMHKRITGECLEGFVIGLRKQTVVRHAVGAHVVRYPFAGAANPRVRLGVTAVDDDTHAVTWMDLGPDPVPNPLVIP